MFLFSKLLKQNLVIQSSICRNGLDLYYKTCALVVTIKFLVVAGELDLDIELSRSSLTKYFCFSSFSILSLWCALIMCRLSFIFYTSPPILEHSLSLTSRSSGLFIN